MTTLTAAELLGKSDTHRTTRAILYFVRVLDFLGARDWSLRTVGLYSFAFLGVIRMILGNKNNGNWWALAHHFATGVGSVMAIYLDFSSAETLTGVSEPLRSCTCGGPLTSLHRILPAITMGYSVLDFMEGLQMSVDFAAHGIMTLIVMLFFCEMNLPHVVVPFLLMEVSSIFLCFCRADFLSATMAVVVQLLFALTFFICRIVVAPYIWFRLMLKMYEHSGNELYQSCINPYAFPVSLGMGVLFHCLNIFWFYKILRKIRRKMSGTKEKKQTKKRPRRGKTMATEEDKENISSASNVPRRRADSRKKK